MSATPEYPIVTKHTAGLGQEKSSGVICEHAFKRARRDDLPSRIALGGGTPTEGMINKC